MNTEQQNMQYSQLQHQAYATIAYFDLFDFAPTLMEVHQWMINTSQSSMPTLSVLRNALQTDDRIHKNQAYYHLQSKAGEHDRSHMSNLRKEKYIHSTQKWRYSKWYLRLLASMPFVEGIWFGNSVAWGNAREGSDIDLIIVTAPGRIWTARFFTTFWMRLFRQRPHETDHSKALCLSFYMTSDSLNLEKHKLAPEDIHFAYWSTQFYPLYDTGVYNKYMQQNLWLTDYFRKTSTVQTIPQRRIQLSRLEHTVKGLLERLPLEKKLKEFQLRILPQPLSNPAPDSGVVISDTILKLHTKDNRAAIQQRWTALLERVS